MAYLARPSDPCHRPARPHRHAILRSLVAPIAFATVLVAGSLAPSISAAEEEVPKAAEGNASSGSRSAATAWRFTKDGPKEIVVTPEQKARQAARKAKRKARHAAEKAAAAAKQASESGKQGAAAPTGKPDDAPKETPPSDKSGAANAGDHINGTEGAK